MKGRTMAVSLSEIRLYLKNGLRSSADHQLEVRDFTTFNRSLFFWGANADCLKFIELIKLTGLDPSGVIDSNTELQQKDFAGLQVISSDKLHAYRPFSIIISTRYNSFSLACNLARWGLENDTDFCLHPLASLGRQEERALVDFTHSAKEKPPYDHSRANSGAEMKLKVVDFNHTQSHIGTLGWQSPICTVHNSPLKSSY
jgi:hypothetical protein